MANEISPERGRSKPAFIRWRTTIAVLHDVAAAALSWLACYQLRFNFEVLPPWSTLMYADLVWILPLQAFVAWQTGVYRGLWRYASLTDLRRILVSTGLGALGIAMVVVLLHRTYIPRSVMPR